MQWKKQTFTRFFKGQHMAMLPLLLVGIAFLFRYRLLNILRRLFVQDVRLTNPNIQAMLRVIRWCEGTDGPSGYRTLFGGKLFNGWADHPRIPKQYGKLWTSAAGAYQFMAVTTKTKVNTWDRIKAKLGLKDFTPVSQDRAALELIAERGAYNAIISGNVDSAISRLNKEWASLPGSPYGQPTKTMAQVKQKFIQYGGKIA